MPTYGAPSAGGTSPGAAYTAPPAAGAPAAAGAPRPVQRKPGAGTGPKPPSIWPSTPGAPTNQLYSPGVPAPGTGIKFGNGAPQFQQAGAAPPAAPPTSGSIGGIGGSVPPLGARMGQQFANGFDRLTGGNSATPPTVGPGGKWGGGANPGAAPGVNGNPGNAAGTPDYGYASGPGILESWFNQRATGTDPGYEYAMKRGMDSVDARMAAGGSYNSSARGQQLSDYAANMGAQRESQLDSLAGGASGEYQGRLNSMFNYGLGMAGAQAGLSGVYDTAAAQGMSASDQAIISMMLNKGGVDAKANQSLANNGLMAAALLA
jgi:hypothetical protein